jgi:hypothetical protein
MADNEKLTDSTKQAEQRDAQAKHAAPQTPTADETGAADRHGTVDPKTGKTYEEYLDTAKDAKGEGRIP